jgi:hypothetical protein
MEEDKNQDVIQQVAVSGIVSYEKVIYETYDQLRTILSLQKIKVSR